MTEPRTFVTFTADFPDDASWDDRGNLLVPGGRTIAAVLATALRLAGSSCTDVVQHSFYGWTFDVTCDNIKCRFVLADGDAEMEWLLQIEGRLSLLGLSFRRSSCDDIRSCQVRVHEILHNDIRFSNVLWHTREDYESCRTDRASPVP
jgi:hypothetical protein